MANQTVHIPVVGMTCANCAANLERTLNKKVPRGQQRQVSFAAESAEVEFDPEQVSYADMAAAAEKIGFTLVVPKESASAELAVVGMTCTNCAANVQRVLTKKVPGVKNAEVSFASETAKVEYDPGLVSLEDMAPRWPKPVSRWLFRPVMKAIWRMRSKRPARLSWTPTARP